MGVRKTIAQVGVVLFIFELLGMVWEPYLVISTYELTLVVATVAGSGVLILLVVAVLPSSNDEHWGSIWPLSGYDNAIDAIYTRGPWLKRFEELDDLDRERGVSSGMTTIFGEDSPS